MLVDRPQAGVSRLPSEVQLIVERKSLSSDFRGVNEVTYDEYDGLWSFTLCFHHGDNEDRLRKEQLLKEAEVLKLITASNLPDDAMKPADNGFQPAASRFDSDCLKLEMSLQVQAVDDQQQESVFLRATNYCAKLLEVDSLAELLDSFDLPRSLVKEAVRTSIDGAFDLPGSAPSGDSRTADRKLRGGARKMR